MAEAMNRRHKRATKKRGCSWRQCVRDVQRHLLDIMAAPNQRGDSTTMQSTALLCALPMIKSAVPREVYEVVARASARLQYIGMDDLRLPPPDLTRPPAATVH